MKKTNKISQLDVLERLLAMVIEQGVQWDPNPLRILEVQFPIPWVQHQRNSVHEHQASNDAEVE
jgi:hypothetical protein